MAQKRKSTRGKKEPASKLAGTQEAVSKSDAAVANKRQKRSTKKTKSTTKTEIIVLSSEDEDSHQKAMRISTTPEIIAINSAKNLADSSDEEPLEANTSENSQLSRSKLQQVSSDETPVEAYTPDNIGCPDSDYSSDSENKVDSLAEFPWLRIPKDNIMMAPDYEEDYFKTVKELESKYVISAATEQQPYITPEMRITLINWLMEIHQNMGLALETLYSTVNLIDRCLSQRVFTQKDLNKVTMTCFFIMSKYEEVNPPRLSEIVELLEGEHDADEIKKAEIYIMGLNGYDLEYPGPMSFMRRANRADDQDDHFRTFCKFILETTLYYNDFISIEISKKTAAAYYIAKFVGGDLKWTKAHEYLTGYTARELQPVVDMIVTKIRSLDLGSMVYFKYSSDDMLQASPIICQSLTSFLGPLPLF